MKKAYIKITKSNHYIHISTNYYPNPPLQFNISVFKELKKCNLRLFLFLIILFDKISKNYKSITFYEKTMACIRKTWYEKTIYRT